MLEYLKKFEKIIITALIVMMTLIQFRAIPIHG